MNGYKVCRDPHNRVSLSNESEWTHAVVGESQRHYAGGNKPFLKGYTLYDSVHVPFWDNSRSKEKMVGLTTKQEGVFWGDEPVLCANRGGGYLNIYTCSSSYNCMPKRK